MAIKAPVPLTARGRPLKFTVTSEGAVVFAHGRSIFTLQRDGSVDELRQSQPLSIARSSPSGSQMAIGDVNGNLCILDAPFGTNSVVRYEGRVLTGRIRDLQWNALGSLVVAVGEGRGLFAAVVETETGRALGELAGPTKASNAVAVSPLEPHSIAVGSDDYSVGIYSERPFRLCKTLQDHSGFVTSVAYSPDGYYLATAGADGRIFLYNGNTTTLIGTLLSELVEKATITGLAWLDNDRMVSSCTDGSIRVWRASTQQCVTTAQHWAQQVLGIQASNNGEYLGVILLDGSLVLLDSKLQILSKHSGHTKAISSLLVSEDHLGYSGDVDGRLGTRIGFHLTCYNLHDSVLEGWVRGIGISGLS